MQESSEAVPYCRCLGRLGNIVAEILPRERARMYWGEPLTVYSIRTSDDDKYEYTVHPEESQLRGTSRTSMVVGGGRERDAGKQTSRGRVRLRRVTSRVFNLIRKLSYFLAAIALFFISPSPAPNRTSALLKKLDAVPGRSVYCGL
jgi:hypothetical protein